MGFDGLEAAADALRESAHLRAPLYPPADARFTEDGGVFGFTKSGFPELSGVEPEMDGGVPSWTLRVAESDGMFAWICGGTLLRTAAIPPHDAREWSRAAYGEPPDGLDAAQEARWYAARARERIEYAFTLVPEDSLAGYAALAAAGKSARGMKARRMAPPYADALAFQSLGAAATPSGSVFRAAAAWPQTLALPEGMLAVLAKNFLAAPGWNLLFTVDVDPLSGAAQFDLPMSGTTINGTNAFFRLATLHDGDDDGLPDFMEEILGTDPANPDTDGDGLADGYEADFIYTDPLDAYSIYGSDPGNPDYADGAGSALARKTGTPAKDSDIVKRWMEPGGVMPDETPDQIEFVGLDLSLSDVYLDDDAWGLNISVPYRDAPSTNAPLNPAGAVLTNMDDVNSPAYKTVYIEAGQNVSFTIDRIKVGQVHWFDEFSVGVAAFIPASPDYPRSGAPNWIPKDDNPAMSAQVAYGPNDEAPDVSEYAWQFTAYKAHGVIVDGDADGLCIVKDTDFTMRCQVSPDPATAYAPLPSGEPKWQIRPLNKQGVWGGWEDIGSGAVPSAHTYAHPVGGVYGIRAFFLGNEAISPIYSRRIDEPYGAIPTQPDTDPKSWWRKGRPNAVGICDTQFQVDLRNEARSYLGSEQYSTNSLVPAALGFSKVERNWWKCTIFVAHQCRSVARNSVPALRSRRWLRRNPPLAKDWADGIPALSKWPVAPNLQPGCVVSTGGHAGITDYDGHAVNAGTFLTHKAYGYFFDADCVYRIYSP